MSEQAIVIGVTETNPKQSLIPRRHRPYLSIPRVHCNRNQSGHVRGHDVGRHARQTTTYRSLHGASKDGRGAISQGPHVGCQVLQIV
jgi:hypothetical protein